MTNPTETAARATMMMTSITGDAFNHRGATLVNGGAMTDTRRNLVNLISKGGLAQIRDRLSSASFAAARSSEL